MDGWAFAVFDVRVTFACFHNEFLIVVIIFKGIKDDENGLPHAEENFEEAIRAVNYALTSDTVPSEISKLLNDDNCVNLTIKVIF